LGNKKPGSAFAKTG